MRRRGVPLVGKSFSLLDERLVLGTEGYSAALVAKIEYAGVHQESFQKAAENLAYVGDLPISGKHVQRITERLGHERVSQRDRQVEQMQTRELPPAYRQPPPVVAVHVDAGKIRLRAEDGRPGVRASRWSDSERPANPSFHQGCSAILCPPIKEVHDGTEEVAVVESTGPVLAEACSAMPEIRHNAGPVLQGTPPVGRGLSLVAAEVRT